MTNRGVVRSKMIDAVFGENGVETPDDRLRKTMKLYVIYGVYLFSVVGVDVPDDP